jgi:hypothetical protein
VLTREVPVPSVRPEAIDEESVQHFAREAIVGLATLDSDDLTPPRLTLPLIVSVWMRRAGVGAATARLGLLALRGALLRESGLDERTEPVPLPVADPAMATLSLAVYLHDLLRRSAHTAAASRLDMAERVAARV